MPRCPRECAFPATATASFTRAGNALLLGIAPPPDDTVPADSLVGKAKFDLWSWKDPQLQPQQLLAVSRERNKTYQSLYNLKARTLARLTTDSLPSISLTDDGTKGVAATSVPYSIQSMWGDDGNDVYAVDVVTGARRLIRQKISGSAALSVDGKYVILFDQGHWYTYAFGTGKTTDITGFGQGGAFRAGDLEHTGYSRGLGHRRLDQGRSLGADLRSLRRLGARSRRRPRARGGHRFGRSARAPGLPSGGPAA